jgi:hypothetical protein
MENLNLAIFNSIMMINSEEKHENYQPIYYWSSHLTVSVNHHTLFLNL